MPHGMAESLLLQSGFEFLLSLLNCPSLSYSISNKAVYNKVLKAK